MSDTALIDRYCQAWSEPDAQRRRAAVESLWAPSAIYTDPSAQATGVDGLLAHIDKVHARWPGARVLRCSEVDSHHGVARFAWRAVEADGNVLLEGMDLAFISSDGARLEGVTGFFGALTARRD